MELSVLDSLPLFLLGSNLRASQFQNGQYSYLLGPRIDFLAMAGQGDDAGLRQAVEHELDSQCAEENTQDHF